MNLEQFLTLWRAADTPEKRTAFLQGMSADQRRIVNPLAIERVTALHGQATRTDDENAEYRDLTMAATELTELVRADSETVDRAAALISSVQVRQPNPALAVNPAQRTDAPHNPENRARQNMDRVGTDVFYRDELGRFRLADGENFISDSTIRNISEPTYQRAYVRYLLGRSDRADMETLRAGNANRAWNSGVDSEGGYLAPPQFVAQLIERQPQESSLFDLVTQRMTDSAMVQQPRNNYTASSIYNNPYRKSYVGEAASPTSQTTPGVGLAEIPIHECKIEVPITRQNREDAQFDMDGMIVRHLRQSFRLSTESDIATNTGVKGPRGILANPGGGTMSDPDTFNIGSSIDPDKLIEFYREVKNPYRRELVCSDDFFAQAEKIKDAAGNYVLAIDNRMINATTNGPVERFRGKPVYFCPFYPDAGAANKVMTWGDHREAYVYALRVGMAILVDDQPRDDYVYFVLRARDGGQVVAPWALKVGVQS